METTGGQALNSQSEFSFTSIGHSPSKYNI
jgi:hypothetical protein